MVPHPAREDPHPHCPASGGTVNIDTYFVPEMYESTSGHLLPYRLYSPCLESDECVPLVEPELLPWLFSQRRK